jgi:hypothetical protein
MIGPAVPPGTPVAPRSGVAGVEMMTVLLRAVKGALLVALLPLAAGRLIVTYQDALMTHLPGKAATVELLRGGELPFLNPHASFGQPLAGNPNFGTFFPDIAAFLVLPLEMAFGLRFALALVLAFTGARRWARAEGASRDAADLAGLAFVLSGVYVSTWRFFNSGLALAVAPWVLAAMARFVAAPQERRRRRAAEVGLWVGLEVLAGEPVIALLAFGLAGLHAATAWRSLGRGGAAWLAAGSIVGALLAGPQIATTMQAYEGSSRDRAPFSYPAATGNSVHPVRMLEQAWPYPFGGPDRTDDGGFRGHRYFDNHAPYLWTLHLGWGTLLLLAVFGRPLERGERVWWAAAAAAIVLSLGYHLPLAREVHPFLSLGGRVRFPIKWWYVVALCVVPLVARAAGRWLSGDPARGPRRAIFAAAGLAALFVTADVPLLRALLDVPPPPPPSLSGGRVFERVRGAEAHPRPDEPPVLEPSTRAFFRRATPELWAITGGVRGTSYAFDRDPDGSYLEEDRLARKAIDDMAWPDRAAELGRAGAAYVVTDEELPAPYVRMTALGDRGTWLYNLPGSAPTVRFLDGAPGRVSPVEERVHGLRARVETPSETVLVWSRSAFPAWRAWVDGAPVPVLRAEGHLVGVRVPAGSHDVTVRWPATPLVMGAAAWVLGVAALLWLRGTGRSDTRTGSPRRATRADATAPARPASQGISKDRRRRA